MIFGESASSSKMKAAVIDLNHWIKPAQKTITQTKH